jgi:ornithine carbamoyltransferase
VAVETFTSVPLLGRAVAGKRDLVSILDVEKDLMGLLELAGNFKNRAKAGETFEPLRGKSLAMIFEKASTRTRVSFEVGMSQLGGHAVNLSPQDTQLGRGETIADTAKVLSRYVDAIMYRAYHHKDMVELAHNATVPVISGLDDLEHPCQIISDLFTILEVKKTLKGLKIAYVGDGNNVCNSLLLGAAIVGAHISVGCPPSNRPNAGILKEAERIARGTGSEVHIVTDPKKAVEGADVVYTDVWVSMGMEKERQERERLFRPYQVNSALLTHAKADAIVMHCLPAHRGLEITDEVIDGPQSVVFDQAENRLHAQKAILARLMGAG